MENGDKIQLGKKTLQKVGYELSYEIKMTPPSDHRELSRGEVTAMRIQNAGSIKGAQIMADYDILTK